MSEVFENNIPYHRRHQRAYHIYLGMRLLVRRPLIIHTAQFVWNLWRKGKSTVSGQTLSEHLIFLRRLQVVVSDDPGKSTRVIAKELHVAELTVRLDCQADEVPTVIHTKFISSVMVLSIVSNEGDDENKQRWASDVERTDE